MGGLLAQLVATATAALNRRIFIYGLWAASGLLLVFAAGYALNALYTFLMFRWGAITARLAIAGGLLVAAAALALVGRFISRTPHKPLYQRLQASPEMSNISKRLARPGVRRALASAAAGVLAGTVAVVTLTRMRGASAARIESSGSGKRRSG